MKVCYNIPQKKGAFFMEDKIYTVLSEKHVFGSNKLDSISKTRSQCAITDFAISLGASVREEHLEKDATLEGRLSSSYVLSSDDGHYNVSMIDFRGNRSWCSSNTRSIAIRPAIYCSDLKEFLKRQYQNKEDCQEVEFGEYPQYAVGRLTAVLETRFQEGLLEKTGKTYTKDSHQGYENGLFLPQILEEYKYNNKKYIRMNYINGFSHVLSNEKTYKRGDFVWLEVSPIQWIIEEKEKLLISKRVILSGIRFCESGKYQGNFQETELYSFLNHYFAQEISPIHLNEEKEVLKEIREEIVSRRNNPYQLNFEAVKEEDIIAGAIEADIPLFIHGASSEGKTARVKQIDPNCVEIHMENASLESFIGKSVYHQATGEMIDIPPTWYVKIKRLCEEEPNKNHILFFEEFTNATPSVQGKVNNVVLDRIVDGKWVLPKNVRIVAAGNEVEDSLAANPIAEPVFNRFAHVYIKTSTADWLKWARKNHIHPAIYSYISYRRGETLRSKYDGIHPNADPRKWEMASKILYKTNNPEMLRSLVGEEITNEFVQFCKQTVITVEDVLTGNYNEMELEYLNAAERYATVMSLSIVEEDDVEKIRDFIEKLGKEFQTLFDVLWAQENEKRLEILSELREIKILKKEFKNVRY